MDNFCPRQRYRPGGGTPTATPLFDRHETDPVADHLEELGGVEIPSVSAGGEVKRTRGDGDRIAGADDITGGDEDLADRIYSGVPAAWFGREQEITIGHQSGESNIRYWLHKRGYEPRDELVKAIFERAKTQSAMLSDADIEAVIQARA